GPEHDHDEHRGGKQQQHRAPVVPDVPDVRDVPDVPDVPDVRDVPVGARQHVAGPSSPLRNGSTNSVNVDLAVPRLPTRPR
ncbi:MAG: hypothetical protein GWN79_21400, partial [Actinobacteria bacterium]|nr:hypothetical protein [Actinomycetota bacterium]NIS34900.1 hypothetical protein [Actinomycetota bacterium]NIT97817.1 hypothetical protein [Actinomycetota bacterium]NIU21465.1 hypothetical protein [Actinomycetota bacterium]NIU69647.1 hypothetical protein [Actinomycetota bacterium]